MKSARYVVRVHAAVFCVAVLFGLSLFSFFGAIEKSRLLLATTFLFVFGETVLGIAHLLGKTLQTDAEKIGAMAPRK